MSAEGPFSLEGQLDDTGQLMEDLGAQFSTPVVSRVRPPGTPGSSARLERLTDTVTDYSERLEQSRGKPAELEQLCAELIGQYRDAERDRGDLAAKLAQQQKELDNAVRLLRQQQSLVSAGLVGPGAESAGQHAEAPKALQTMTQMMQEMLRAVEHVKPAHSLGSLPQDFLHLHSQIDTDRQTLPFADAALGVRCRMATLMDDVMRPPTPSTVRQSPCHSPPPAPTPREVSMQKEKLAAMHSTLLAVMGKFGLIGRVVPSHCDMDEAIERSLSDIESLLACTEGAVSHAVRQLGRAVSGIIPFSHPFTGGAAGGGVPEYLAKCAEVLEGFAEKACTDLSEVTSTGLDLVLLASAPTVMSLVNKAKAVASRRMVSDQHSSSTTRMRQIASLSTSILEAVSPEDADRLRDRDPEGLLRTALVHVEAFREKAGEAPREIEELGQQLAEARGAGRMSQQRLRHVGEMLSEILLDPAKLSLRDASGELAELELRPPPNSDLSVEDKLSELHVLYQEKRDRCFDLESELDACNSAMNHAFAACGQHFRSSEPLKLKLDALPDIIRGAGGGAEVNSSRITDEDSHSSDEADIHKIYAMLKATNRGGEAGMPRGVTVGSVESAIAQLNERVRGAERHAAELETHTRRTLSRVQELVQQYDCRSPSRRHVHLGDLDEYGSDVGVPMLDDLEALLQALSRSGGGGGGGGDGGEHDTMLDMVEGDLRLMLPQVESLVGVPVGPDLTVNASDGPEGRLAVTMSRWRRALEQHRAGVASGVAHGERVLLRTIQHITARLRAALSAQDLPQDAQPSVGLAPLSRGLDGDTLSSALSELDHYTGCASGVVERYGTERTRVMATLQTIVAAARDVQKGSVKALQRDPVMESEIHVVSQTAAASVADLVGRYSGAHTRLQRLSAAVLASAAAIDKIVPSKVEARSMSISRRSEEVPEFVLQEAVNRLTSRTKGKSQPDVETVSSPRALPDGTIEQLRLLASQAPTGSSLDELVSAVAERLAAYESDRAVQKKEGERARTAWRKLHDEVTRRLAPLVDTLETDPKARSRSPPNREQEDEGKKAFGTIVKLDQKVQALIRQHQLLTSEHTGERARRIDLEQRLKGIKKQYAKTSKELVRMCVLTEVTAVPVADELSSDIDIEATSRALYESVNQLAETACQVAHMRAQVTQSAADAEESRAHAAKTEMHHLHLLNAVTDVLSVLGLMPEPPRDADSAWDDAVSGVSKMLTEVREGREACARVETLEGMLDSLLREVHGTPAELPPTVTDNRFSLSPLTATSFGTPHRHPPSPPSPAQQQGAVIPADTSKLESFRNRCTDVMETFRSAARSVQNEQRLEQDLKGAQDALQRIQGVLHGQDTYSADEPKADPAATADSVAEKVQHLIEVSAASAAEKAKLIRQNLELKQGLEQTKSDLGETRTAMHEANETCAHLKRKLESAQMFVTYAKEMMEDADADAGRDASDTGGEEEDDFQEVVAVRAYQAYLTLRKDREALRRKLEDAEAEVEELQLQEDFFGGISAKVISLDAMCTEACNRLAGGAGSDSQSSSPSSRAPSRTPPAKPDGSPTTILNHIASIAKTLGTIKSEAASLGSKLEEAVSSADVVASTLGLDLSPPTADMGSAAAYLHSALSVMRERVAARLRHDAQAEEEVRQLQESTAKLEKDKKQLLEQVRHQQQQLQVREVLQPRMEPPARRPPAPGDGLSPYDYASRPSRMSDADLLDRDPLQYDGVISMSSAPRHRGPVSSGSALRLSEDTASTVSATSGLRRAASVNVSPQRVRGGDPRELYEIERAMLSLTNKLEELVGKVPVASDSPVPTLPDIAWHVDKLCAGLLSELTYLARSVMPGQPVLHAVKANFAAPPPTSEQDLALGGVKAAVGQLKDLGNAIASAPPRDCTRLLLKNAKSSDDDAIGLQACIRRLHVIIANKLDAAPREIKELRARCELLDAHVKGLEAEGGRRSANLITVSEAERRATQALGLQKDKWEQQRRSLEDRLGRAEGARDTMQEQLDAAQSTLALSRSRLGADAMGGSLRGPQTRAVSPSRATPAHGRRGVSQQPSRSPSRARQNTGPVQAGLEKENDALKAQLHGVSTQYEEMREAAERLTERVEEKEQARKDYKEKYKRALEEVGSLEEERERLKQGFAAQLTSVKEQLVKLQSQRGGRSKTASADPSRVRTTSNPSSSMPRDLNRDAITVPQEFRLHKVRGRTGCWVCDSPDGPTKYGGAVPLHNCPAPRSQSSSRAGASEAYSASPLAA